MHFVAETVAHAISAYRKDSQWQGRTWQKNVVVLEALVQDLGRVGVLAVVESIVPAVSTAGSTPTGVGVVERAKPAPPRETALLRADPAPVFRKT